MWTGGPITTGVQILRDSPTGAALIVALLISNWALNGLEIERRSIAMCSTELRESHTLIIREVAVSDLHFATVYGFRTDLGGCKIPPDTPISFCTSRQSLYKRSAPMLCPSTGDGLATPLMHIFTETTTSDENWAVSWERRRSQCVQSYSLPNTLLHGWEGLKLTPLKKGSLMVRTLKKFTAAHSAAKLLQIFPFRAVQYGLYTSNLLPTPMLHLFHTRVQWRAKAKTKTCRKAALYTTVTFIPSLASFPGPAQLSVAISNHPYLVCICFVACH